MPKRWTVNTEQSSVKGEVCPRVCEGTGPTQMQHLKPSVHQARPTLCLYRQCSDVIGALKDLNRAMERFLFQIFQLSPIEFKDHDGHV